MTSLPAGALARQCPMFDPFADDLIASPYETYDGLRREEGLYWSAMLGAWVVTRMEDVRAVLGDPGFVAVDVTGILEEMARRAGRDYHHLIKFLKAVLFFKDGPAHEAERRTIAKVINAVKLSQLEHTVQAIAADLASTMSGRDTIDAVRDFAEPLPQRVMAYILGIPATDVPTLGELLADVTLIFDAASLKTYDRLEIKARAAMQLVMTRIEEAVSANLNTGLCRIFADAVGGGTERLENAAATVIFVLRVGAETTVGLIGLLIRRLVEQPDMLAQTGADPRAAERIVNEALRVESNVQRAARMATGNRIIAGTPVRAGDRMLVLIGSANMDPASFARPEQMQTHADRPPDLSFGGGKHFCLGASLARMEGRITLEVFGQLPRYQRDGAETWFASRTIRRLTALPLRLAR